MLRDRIYMRPPAHIALAHLRPRAHIHLMTTTRAMLTLTERAEISSLRKAGTNPCLVAQRIHEMLTGETKEALAAARERGFMR